MAKVARAWIEDASSASSVAFSSGIRRVADRLPVGVGLLRVDDVPGAADRPVGVALRLPTRVVSRVRACGRRCRKGCLWVHRDPLGLDLVDGVAHPVHGHVEPGGEQVLVVRRAQPGGDLGGVLVRRAGGEEHAGELDLELDGAVEVEVPVEAVVVVADRGEERDHQAALAAHFPGVGEQVRVLPDDAEVLLVHADGVADRLRVAEVVGDDGVGVVDVAEAVATQLERVGVAGEHVLAAVEVVLPVPHRRRVGVGHHHLRDAGPVGDGRPSKPIWCRVRPSRSLKP